MAEKRIDELPAAASITGAERLIVEQGAGLMAITRHATIDNLRALLDLSANGFAEVSFIDADLVLPVGVGGSDLSRRAFLYATSIMSMTAPRLLTVPSAAKAYSIWNNTTGGQSLTVKTAATAGGTVTIPNGYSCEVLCDGTNIRQRTPFLSPSTGATKIAALLATSGAFTGAVLAPAVTTDALVSGTGAFTGAVTAAGNVTVAKPFPAIYLAKAESGQAASIYGALEGALRWAVALGDGATESGSNSGSGLTISRYTDAGALIDIPFSINRASGGASFSQSLTIEGAAAWHAGNFNPAVKQDALGFTAVQQGTGSGQTSNAVKIGWSAGERLKVTVDSTDLGNVVFDEQLDAKQNALGFTPVNKAGDAMTGALTAPRLTSSSAANPLVSVADTAQETATGLMMGAANTAYIVNVATDGSYSGVWRASFGASGDFVAAGNVTSTSDARLKKDVTTIANALAMVRGMRGVRYTMIESNAAGLGVIAQEMQGVAPEVVHGDDHLSVAYGNLVGVLIEAVKEIAIRLDALESR